MSRYHSYLNTAETILRQYRGETPFAIFLKQFFAAQRQMGSRDRKTVSRLCYQVFRLGHWHAGRPAFERVLEAARLFGADNIDFLAAVDPASVQEGQALPVPLPPAADLFPFQQLLCKGIDGQAFALSFLQQPHLFLRLRPGFGQRVKETLTEAGVPWQEPVPDTLQLPNGTDVSPWLSPDRWAVVQDFSSQQTGRILRDTMAAASAGPLNAWDACAASGGKGIMLHDLFPDIHLTVSDIRDSILQNLATRFRSAGITARDAFVANLTQPQKAVPHAPFDLVVADVPCTGSGTWARTPENLVFFDESSIQQYAIRQLAIARECLRWLKPGGWLAYITCSVFAAENEGVVQQLLEQPGLRCLTAQPIAGWTNGADSMYVAVLQKQ